jgi:Domain of unknown function (DUF4280)
MSEKHIVVQGATCKCMFSVEPKTDMLKVMTQTKDFANDKDASQKRIATDKEIGQTLEKNSFGKCKLQPTGNNFLPCMAVILKWSNFYKDVTLSNGGKILTEDSKATCPIGGPDCISIDKHGQKTQGSAQNSKNANDDVQSQLNPLVNPKDIGKKKADANGITLSK